MCVILLSSVGNATGLVGLLFFKLLIADTKLFVAVVTWAFVASSSLLTLIASAKASCNAFHDLSV